MAKLYFVKKAQKTYRGTGIKKGTPYWWFKHRRGPKVRCKTKPHRGAYATTSLFLRTVWLIEDDLRKLMDDAELAETNGDSESELDLGTEAELIRGLAEDCRFTKESIDRAFPNGCPTADQMEERAEACDSIADALEAGDIERALSELSSVS